MRGSVSLGPAACAWTRLKFVALVIALIALFAAKPATAEEQPPSEAVIQQATERYERGIRLYGADAYDAALLEFRKAYELAPNFRVLYNIAQVCFQLKDYVCALQSFEAYLSQGSERVPSDRRAEVEKEIATLRTLVSPVNITTNTSGVSIAIDDIVVGTTPLANPILVAVGRRKITAAKDGLVPLTRMIDVPSGAASSIALELKPFGATSARSESHRKSSGDRARTQEPPRLTLASWIGLGSAAALGVGGAVLGILALDKNAEYKDSPHRTEDAGKSQRDSARNLALASDLLLGASVATLGTTLILTFATGPESTGKVGLSVAPQGLSAFGKF